MKSPAWLNQQVALICTQFLLQFTHTISYFIDIFLSNCLPTVAQQVAAAEEDDKATMLAEFEVNFSWSTGISKETVTKVYASFYLFLQSFGSSMDKNEMN